MYHDPARPIGISICTTTLRSAQQPRGFTAVGIFLSFGATMAALAAITLLWHGTVIDRLWTLNPKAYQQLAPLGSKAGFVFLFLSTALLMAGVGWFRRNIWGWRLAVAIIGTQIIGDIVNLIRGDVLRGGTGVAIAGALLFYLLTPGVKGAFSNNAVRTPRQNRPTFTLSL